MDLSHISNSWLVIINLIISADTFQDFIAIKVYLGGTAPVHVVPEMLVAVPIFVQSCGTWDMPDILTLWGFQQPDCLMLSMIVVKQLYLQSVLWVQNFLSYHSLDDITYMCLYYRRMRICRYDLYIGVNKLYIHWKNTTGAQHLEWSPRVGRIDMLNLFIEELAFLFNLRLHS